MKVAGGLQYVTGPMGSGKSFYGVRKIVSYVTSGRYVVTNVELYDDWAHRVARRVAPFGTLRYRQRLAGKFERYYVYEESLSEAMRYRVPGRGEARALFVWDETHNDLNNRDWRKDGRQEILEWATQLRKLGFVGYLLSQHADNTDAALRRVCNWLVRLQNQKQHVRLMGLPLTPWPLFLASWYATNIPSGSKQTAVKVERYFLGWHRKLYDTHGLYHGLANDQEQDVIWLGGEVPSLPARSSTAKPVEGVAGGGLPPGGFSVLPGVRFYPAGSSGHGRTLTDVWADDPLNDEGPTVTAADPSVTFDAIPARRVLSAG